MHVVVIGGGGLGEVAPQPPPLAADLVIAADSGYDRALAAGIGVDVLIGDLDSISSSALSHARARGDLEIIEHPADKDATDLTLALQLAVERGARTITVLASGGGRLDHLMALVLSLAEIDVPVTALLDGAVVHCLGTGGRALIEGQPGDVVTLLAVGGPANGITTTGLRFCLDGESLTPGSTRGVSNELSATAATVNLGDGRLLVISPGKDHP